MAEMKMEAGLLLRILKKLIWIMEAAIILLPAFLNASVRAT